MYQFYWTSAPYIKFHQERNGPPTPRKKTSKILLNVLLFYVCSPVYGNGGRLPSTPGAGTIRVYNYQESFEDGGERAARRRGDAAAALGSAGAGGAKVKKKSEGGCYDSMNTWLEDRPVMVLVFAVVLSVLTSAITTFIIAYVFF